MPSTITGLAHLQTTCLQLFSEAHALNFSIWLRLLFCVLLDDARCRMQDKHVEVVSCTQACPQCRIFTDVCIFAIVLKTGATAECPPMRFSELMLDRATRALCGLSRCATRISGQSNDALPERALRCYSPPLGGKRAEPGSI